MAIKMSDYKGDINKRSYMKTMTHVRMLSFESSHFKQFMMYNMGNYRHQISPDNKYVGIL